MVEVAPVLMTSLFFNNIIIFQIFWVSWCSDYTQEDLAKFGYM
jgi:hypothetical protein